MKHLIPLAFLALACGAPSEEELALASLEEAYSASVTTNIQHGARTSTSPDRNRYCDRGTASQTCSVPKGKIIEYALGNTAPGWSFDEEIAVASAAVLLDGATNFVFVQRDFSDPLGFGATRITINRGVVTGDLSFNLDKAVSTSFGNVTALTEGVVGADPVGNYQAHGFCTTTLDTADIYADHIGQNRQNVLAHAIGHSMAICMGVGARTDAAANLSMSSSNVTATQGARTLTPGEACRASSFTTTNNTDFSLTGFACPTVD